MSENLRVYRTGNLYLSAVLIASGVELKESIVEFSTKHGRYGLTFVFEDFDRATKIAEEHFNKELTINSDALIAAYIKVKDQSKNAMNELASAKESN